jgi:hypothetical protein
MLRVAAASRFTLRRELVAAAAPLSASTTAAAWDYDVAIVGGGVVGAALACQLAQTPSLAGRRILVVESLAPPPLNAALAPGRPVRVVTRVAALLFGVPQFRTPSAPLRGGLF